VSKEDGENRFFVLPDIDLKKGIGSVEFFPEQFGSINSISTQFDFTGLN
jgi:hypothetical protein